MFQLTKNPIEYKNDRSHIGKNPQSRTLNEKIMNMSTAELYENFRNEILCNQLMTGVLT